MGAIFGGEAGLEPQDAPAVQARCTASVGALQAGCKAGLSLGLGAEYPSPTQDRPGDPAGCGEGVGGSTPHAGHLDRGRRIHRDGFRDRMPRQSAAGARVGGDRMGAHQVAGLQSSTGIRMTAVESEIAVGVRVLDGPGLQMVPSEVRA